MPATEDPVIWFYLGMNREKKKDIRRGRTLYLIYGWIPDIWLFVGCMVGNRIISLIPDRRPDSGYPVDQKMIKFDIRPTWMIFGYSFGQDIPLQRS